VPILLCISKVNLKDFYFLQGEFLIVSGRHIATLASHLIVSVIISHDFVSTALGNTNVAVAPLRLIKWFLF
jgi:hypothetical protein